MKEKILLVGSGPSVYGSLLHLRNIKNIDISLIDNSELKVDLDDKKCIFENNFVNSSRVNNLNHFESKTYEFFEKTAKISKSFGGFSNVWGGTVDIPSESTIEAFNLLDINILKYFLDVYENIQTYSDENNYNIYFKRFKKFKKNLNIKVSNIALGLDIANKIKSTKICKICDGYEWSCRNNTIWNSKSEIFKMIEELDINYVSNAKLLKFKEDKKNKKVICSLLIKNEEKIEIFDKVIIGAGPLATSIIFLNSNITNKVIFKSSDMIQIPFIKFKSTQKKMTSFSDLFVYDKKNKFYLQIYFFSKSVLKLANNLVKINQFEKILPKKVLNLFGGIFVYLDSELSTSFGIKKTNNKLKLFYNDSTYNSKKVKKEIYSYLKNVGIFPLKILQNKLLYGNSYHFGAQFEHSIITEFNKTDRVGRLSSLEYVHIIDASVLPVINNGPLTVLTIANSYRIAKEIFKVE